VIPPVVVAVVVAPVVRTGTRLLAALSVVGMPEVRLVGWGIALPVVSVAASALGVQIGRRLLAL
jgi:hypothetical protein